MTKEWNTIINLAKIVYVSLGFLFMGLGIVGIVVPLLPTTPLLLLASFFFAKGSKRFEIWFKGTGVYKKYLESFVRDRAMTRRQKITISLISDTMMAIPFIMNDNLMLRLTLLLIVAYKYYYFITKIRTITPNLKPQP
ncbi:YbaN family protein [Bacillus massilinigeriensis]|uniref:YbaN family protein n=1 Tax=Bacillus mediterraneensis TaxID=1805474 RepID=UPI0008F833EE|nr:YbaN family protein [Bacillus mediterraneensis]